jgi:hypothetical protein
MVDKGRWEISQMSFTLKILAFLTVNYLSFANECRWGETVKVLWSVFSCQRCCDSITEKPLSTLIFFRDLNSSTKEIQ